jgi:hypothetical protein
MVIIAKSPGLSVQAGRGEYPGFNLRGGIELPKGRANNRGNRVVNQGSNGSDVRLQRLNAIVTPRVETRTYPSFQTFLRAIPD